jgi:hypothetical protein
MNNNIIILSYLLINKKISKLLLINNYIAKLLIILEFNKLFKSIKYYTVYKILFGYNKINNKLKLNIKIENILNLEVIHKYNNNIRTITNSNRFIN